MASRPRPVPSGSRRTRSIATALQILGLLLALTAIILLTVFTVDRSRRNQVDAAIAAAHNAPGDGNLPVYTDRSPPRLSSAPTPNVGTTSSGKGKGTQPTNSASTARAPSPATIANDVSIVGPK